MDKISRRWRPIKGRDGRRRKSARENVKLEILKRKKKSEKVKKSKIIEQHNPSTSASTRKLEYFQKADREHDEGEFLLIHTSAIECFLKQYLGPECNKIGSVKNKMKNRFGQATEVVLFCENCEEDIDKVFTSPRNDNSSRFVVNEKVVDGFSKIESGYSSMETFCASLGMHVMSINTYYSDIIF